MNKKKHPINKKTGLPKYAGRGGARKGAGAKKRPYEQKTRCIGVWINNKTADDVGGDIEVKRISVEAVNKAAKKIAQTAPIEALQTLVELSNGAEAEKYKTELDKMKSKNKK